VTKANNDKSSESGLNSFSRKSISGHGRFNMGGIIAMAIFGSFVFLAAILIIIIIVFRRYKSSSSSMDSQTISTLDSNSDQNGFYRNYQKAWENLKYAGGHGAASYKPTLGRLDAMEYAFSPLHASPTQSHNHRTAMVRTNLYSEGYRDMNEITLNADVAALYSRPDKPVQPTRPGKKGAELPLPTDLYSHNARRKF
jgi:hypothetical protein